MSDQNRQPAPCPAPGRQQPRPDEQPETGAERQVRELLEHCLAAAELQLRVQYRRWR